MILIDSFFQAGKNYYSQIFFQECKYIIKEKRISNYIIEDAKKSDREYFSEDDSDEEDSSKNIIKILF